jgi:hypothetical protein
MALEIVAASMAYLRMGSGPTDRVFNKLIPTLQTEGYETVAAQLTVSIGFIEHSAARIPRPQR